MGSPFALDAHPGRRVSVRRHRAEGCGDLFAVAPEATTLHPAQPPATRPANVRLVRFDQAPAAGCAGEPVRPPTPRSARRWGAHTEALVEVCAWTFAQRGMPPALARAHAEAALIALADHCGGRIIYLPRAVGLKTANRDAKLRREYDGNNVEALAVRYRLTPRHVRKILAGAPKPRTRWGTHTALLVELIARSFEARGMSSALAHGHAQAAMIALGNYGGGRALYVPCALRLKNALRDAQIVREFTGRNLDALAERYDITPRQVRKIIDARKVRKTAST